MKVPDLEFRHFTLSERDRLLAEAHMARAETMVQFAFAVAAAFRKLAHGALAFLGARANASSCERTRRWPHGQA